MAERQKIIETNRSIRTIKNELESLLEKDIISYDSYQSIHGLLPAEASLHSAAPTPQPVAAKVAAPSPAPPTNDFNNLSLNNNNNNAPPSYHQTTAAAPPALPTRNGPPAPPPSKPIIAHAKALYAYTASDARDVGFERNDTIQVYEYMNADWWMGRNERTGAEGIFPRTYVEALPGPPPAAAYNEKSEKAPYYAPAQPVYGGYPPPPQQQQNPYNSSAPPMAVANEQQQQQVQEDGAGGKAGGMGKKFGKKLGNAAIFGAGATIGSNIVNSIF